MDHREIDNFRSRLADRREKLVTAISASETTERYQALLQQVDDALAKMDNGTFGVCESCHGEVEVERLIVDPLVTFCLDCLTEFQQRELEQDLELASTIQSTLLPENDFQRDGWSIAYHYQPAGPVSGDYCDLIPVNDDSDDLLFFIGDVSGKGIAASMLMSQLHAIFHSLTALNISLGELLERANRLVCESTLSTHFVTLVCGRLFDTGKIQLSNAGHCPPILLQGDKSIEIDSTGLPIGLFCNGGYQVQELELKPGDSLVLYTDGLSETFDGQGEYGADRIVGVAASNRGLHPKDLIQAHLVDLRAFDHGAPRLDDLSIMAIRRS